jgi:hypothetical protein
MPAYVFDYITSDGPKREAFTLDDDQPVGVQVRRVLAELRERGVVLLGGRDDQLSIEWNGVQLNEELSVGALGVTAFRPIELRMRPRHAATIEVRPSFRAGAPRTHFVPLGVISAALTGALGGACAWTAIAVIEFAEAPTQDRDALATLLLVGSVGLLVVLALHGLTRRIWLGLLGIALGAPLTAAVSVGVIDVIMGANAPFLAHRVALFASIGGLGALMLALSAPHVGTLSALGESLAFGALTGICAALIGSLESLGVSGALAWPLLGAGMASSAVWPRLRRAYALCEQLPARRRLLATLTMRSHAVPHRGSLRLEEGARVERQGQDVLWAAPVALAIEGRPISGTGMVVNGDHVQVGRRTYRFREIP